MYALVDANAFYVSAEQVFRPQWRHRPVIVLSNNDGCIVAANRQAIALGIKKFSPYFKARALCERHGIIACSSNYELYADLSAKMMATIGRFAPEQYIYSIDECFLSFIHYQSSIPCLTTHAQQLRQTVWKECRLPVCVGMANTLTLAKVANYAAKKLPDYQGVCVIDSVAKRQHILQQLACGEVWGIGRRLAKQLALMGIHHGLALAQLPPAQAKKRFSVEVERIVRELNGEPCKTWGTAIENKQQIFSTRSVGQRIVTPQALNQALSKHAAIAAAKARKQHSLCGYLTAFASNSPHDERPVSMRFSHRFGTPTDDPRVISKVISQQLGSLFIDGVRYYKIGVGLVDLIDRRFVQPDLFEPDPSDPRLITALDKINARYGRDALFIAAQGTGANWAMRRQLLTPQYTTRWQDLPLIKA